MWVFNHDHKWWGKRHVRRGLAYLHNQEDMYRAARDIFEPERILDHPTTNLTDAQVQQYLPDVELERYDPRASQPEQARAEFEAAGWSKEDGTWVDENGEEVVFRAKSVSTVQGRIRAIRVMNEQNESFGLTSEMVTVEGSTYWNDFGQGNFPVQWAAWQATLPSSAFQSSIAGPIGKQQLNVPRTVTVPEIGDVGGEDSLEVNIDDQMEAMRTAQTEEEFATAIRTLAWVCNQTVPGIPNYIGTHELPIDTERWNWPAADDPVWSTPSPVAYLTQFQGYPQKK
jgi:peptide/nickel transport system substrate-binding protein